MVFTAQSPASSQSGAHVYRHKVSQHSYPASRGAHNAAQIDESAGHNLRASVLGNPDRGEASDSTRTPQITPVRKGTQARGEGEARDAAPGRPFRDSRCKRAGRAQTPAALAHSSLWSHNTTNDTKVHGNVSEGRGGSQGHRTGRPFRNSPVQTSRTRPDTCSPRKPVTLAAQGRCGRDNS